MNRISRYLTITFWLCAAGLATAQESVLYTRGSQKITINKGGVSSFNVEVRGKLELTDDDKDIKSMSPDGYLEITKTVFGNKRSLVISSGNNGLKREYYEGRTLVEFEPAGRKWMSEILPELVRSTTIGGESRVNRFYQKGGTRAVLNEIKSLESDYVKVFYGNALMSLSIPDKDYAVAISEITSGMESDHYRSEFLRKGMDKFLKNKDATQAVFAATQNFESDHYRTEVIKEALSAGPATLENVKVILQATSKMESDHYKTEVLSALLRQNNLTDAMVAEMINATLTMESDHYRSVILSKALDKPGLSAASYKKVVESVRGLDSDHYKTQVLTELLQNNLPHDEQMSLIDLLSAFDSDHYLTQVGIQFLKKQTLDEVAFQRLLETVAGRDSDFYASSFLQAALQRQGLSKQNLMTILQVAGSIESDHYITEVLVNAAPQVKSQNDAALKDAYRQAARKIESDTYYGRALKALD